MTVAALYIDPRGPYPLLDGVDAWDAERDARLYQGPHPVVAHPPCGPWGSLRHLCRYQDRALAPLAVEAVLRWGGVLEHPAGSLLWQHCGLPLPGGLPLLGPNVRTVEIEQVHWGHACRKRTWLLCVRVGPLRPAPLPNAEPTHWASSWAGEARANGKLVAGASIRRRTPPLLAAELVRLAATAVPEES